jgi:hypothetical protein
MAEAGAAITLAPAGRPIGDLGFDHFDGGS